MKDQVTVVLVRPLYARNIGAASRAIENMGFQRLVLIAPQCEVDYSAQQAAATCQGPLQGRKVYSSWDEFYQHEGEGLRIALTRRSGRLRSVRDLGQTLTELRLPLPQDGTQFQLDRPLYLFFGPEDSGLSTDDTMLMNYCCSLPAYSALGSMNLAQAVLLGLFILRQALGTPSIEDIEVATSTKPEPEPMYYPNETIRRWLETLGFQLDEHQINAHSVFTRMLLQNNPTKAELHLLECILQQNIRKLRELRH